MIAAFFTKHWLRIGLAAAVALAVGWVVLELRQAARLAVQVEQLEQDLADAEQRDRIRQALNAAEADRLADEQETRLTFGNLQNEALADPSAPEPALGVRNVQRLNQIR